LVSPLDCYVCLSESLTLSFFLPFFLPTDDPAARTGFWMTAARHLPWAQLEEALCMHTKERKTPQRFAVSLTKLKFGRIDLNSRSSVPASSPEQGDRLLGALSAVKTRAPITGGSFAVWGGMFSSFDCSLAYIRQKEDPWNSIASGFLTGGVLTLRCNSLSPFFFFSFSLRFSALEIKRRGLNYIGVRMMNSLIPSFLSRC